MELEHTNYTTIEKPYYLFHCPQCGYFGSSKDLFEEKLPEGDSSTACPECLFESIEDLEDEIKLYNFFTSKILEIKRVIGDKS